jgi:hypothetical protein
MNKKIIATTLIIAFSSTTFAHPKENIKRDSSLNYPHQAQTEKKVNAKIFIPGLFIGWLGGAVDFKVKENLSIGPIFKVFAYGENNGYSLGLEGNYSLTGDVMSTGWIINPYLQYYHSNVGVSDDDNYTSDVVGGMNIAHQWVWDEGVNIQLGVGLMYSQHRFPLNLANTNVSPNFDFSIGYLF